MQVYALFNYNDHIEGIYTAAGKEKQDAELLEQATLNREQYNQQIVKEIVELRELRQPFIMEAEMLLEEERSAKEANHTGKLKEARKKRKIALRQAEHLTYDIKRKEEKVLASHRMTKTEILSTYGRDYYWEEYYLEGD